MLTTTGVGIVFRVAAGEFKGGAFFAGRLGVAVADGLTTTETRGGSGKDWLKCTTAPMRRVSEIATTSIEYMGAREDGKTGSFLIPIPTIVERLRFL